MGQKSKTQITVATRASYTLTNAAAIVAPATGPALTIVCPKTGYYDVVASVPHYIGGAGNDCITYIAINTLKCSKACYSLGVSAGERHSNTIIIKSAYLIKGDVLSVYAYYTVINGTVVYTANRAEPYLQITEV